MAVELETDIDVQTLFGLLQEIEQKLGRGKIHTGGGVQGK